MRLVPLLSPFYRWRSRGSEGIHYLYFIELKTFWCWYFLELTIKGPWKVFTQLGHHSTWPTAHLRHCWLHILILRCDTVQNYTSWDWWNIAHSQKVEARSPNHQYKVTPESLSHHTVPGRSWDLESGKPGPESGSHLQVVSLWEGLQLLLVSASGPEKMGMRLWPHGTVMRIKWNGTGSTP